MASWGVEVRWRAQKEWQEEMVKLQNAVMSKVLGATKGSMGRKTATIGAVEDIETFARAARGHFLARTICVPDRARIGERDKKLEDRGNLSLGEFCWGGDVEVVELGACQTSMKDEWAQAIERVRVGSVVVYIDGSRNDAGQVGGGWFAKGTDGGAGLWERLPRYGMARLQACARYCE